MLDVHVARENLRLYIFIANLVMLRRGLTSENCVKFTCSVRGWVRDRKLAAGGHSKLQSSFLMSAFVERKIRF